MRTYIIAILAAALLYSCKSSENLSGDDVVARMTEKVAEPRYTFVPTSAIPMSGRTVNLDNSYLLKVSKDTISSYLPYFGRAYTAPVSTTDGGIKFVSTDFNYTTSDKKKGMWKVSMEIKDSPSRYRLFLSIGDSGYASLTVQENNRQSITFYGKIE